MTDRQTDRQTDREPRFGPRYGKKSKIFFFAYFHILSSPTRENVFFGVRFALTRFLGRYAPQKTKRNMLRDQHRFFID